ncbi:MAG: hypothetical protein P8X79_00915 [Reinekea sp.]
MTFNFYLNPSMGAPAIFEKQIEIKLLHPASTEGVTDSGSRHYTSLPLVLLFRMQNFLTGNPA